jgi:hypothetical protein
MTNYLIFRSYQLPIRVDDKPSDFQKLPVAYTSIDDLLPGFQKLPVAYTFLIVDD